jgi:hypothetical protein
MGLPCDPLPKGMGKLPLRPYHTEIVETKSRRVEESAKACVNKAKRFSEWHGVHGGMAAWLWDSEIGLISSALLIMSIMLITAIVALVKHGHWHGVIGALQSCFLMVHNVLCSPLPTAQ